MSDAVREQVEGQKEVQEQATEGQLHATNLQQGLNQESRADLIQEAVRSDLDGPSGLTNIGARDFPLGNLDDADVNEARWMFEIYQLLDEVNRPHPNSGMIGPFRVWASHGEAEPVFPPSMEDVNEAEQYTFGSYTRATRGHQMAQQETAAKSIQESWLHNLDDEGNQLREKLNR